MIDEFSRLVGYVRQSWANCGRSHAELVARGLEADLSLTLAAGELLAAVERHAAADERYAEKAERKREKVPKSV